MQKIKIRLPASLINLGPGLNSLGLALSLYTTVEISGRSDEQLLVETYGEGAGRYSIGLRHPVVLALARVFQRLERAPSGITIRVDNQIPLNSGLGAETAFLVAGVTGANNLMGNVYSRDSVMEIAAQISRADSAVSAMLGGLSTSVLENEKLYYRSLPVAPMKVVVVLPELEKYTRPPLPERVPTGSATHNLSRLPLFIEALRTGDLKLLSLTLPDYLHNPRLIPQITGYAQVSDLAKRAGAAGVTVAGDGPALVMFAGEKQLQDVSEISLNTYRALGIPARSWILPVDTQGVIISVMGKG
jgi:homoserine kinase